MEPVLTRTDRADFALEVKFEKNSPNPARVFRAMTELIQGLERLDNDLIKSIHTKIEPILLLEDVETSSIRAFLLQELKSSDDEDIKNLDWKRIVGAYLVRAKYYVVDFLEHRTQITDRLEIEQLEARMLQAAKETDVLRFPSYAPIPTSKLLARINDLNTALGHLSEGDEATYITAGNRASFNLDFNFSPEAVEDLLTRERIDSESVMILKVKKPDYLGDSQWVLRHGGRSFSAKVSHPEWLADFQNRRVDVRPGDSIRARVHQVVKYDHDGEVIGTTHEVLQVLEVIPMPAAQPPPGLFDEGDDDGDDVAAMN